MDGEVLIGKLVGGREGVMVFGDVEGGVCGLGYGH